MDLLDIKGRVALAFVESIFRRAGFALTPLSVREGAPRPGRAEFVPHFLAERPAGAGGGAAQTRWPIEVRYRPQVAQYVAIEERRGPQSVFALAGRQWPALLFVFVTDRPEPGRSAFQALDLGHWKPGDPAILADLHTHPALDIYRQNVEEHEILIRRIFLLVTGSE